ncbi:MAG: aspartate/glutamate racemase family protein [Pseudomonas gingeri]
MSVQRFLHYDAAVQAMSDYQAALCENASGRRSKGLTVTDQDYPEEVFCLFPARPHRPPLAIVGGMGPLAGALAFRQACQRFQNSRVVVLYQACSMPDRSTVILGEGQPDTPLCHEVAVRLADAVRMAVDFVSGANQPAHCIIACNSAHYFWRLLADDLRQTAARVGKMSCNVRMISLVESAVNALRLQSCKRALLLATEGAQAGKVFSAPCRDAGIAFDEPSPTLSRLLMSAIFEGLKSLDERRAVELGNEFFESILRCGRDDRRYDFILAGCTEVPPTIALLRLRGSPAVAAFLAHVKIVDPMEEALGHA